MSNRAHERPGVYSRYDASTVVRGTGGGRVVGIAARCTKGETDKLYRMTRYEEAVSTFGAAEGLTELVGLLLQNGAAQVCAVPVGAGEEYTAAFTLLGAAEGIAVTVCDSTELTVQQALRQSMMDAAEARRERICVVCGGADETVAALVQRAEGLNCERVVPL